MERHQMASGIESYEAEFSWAFRQSQLTQNALKECNSLENIKIAFCIHLDVKNAVCLRGLLDRGCKMFITTCNPATVRNEVVEDLRQHGAEIVAWKNMSSKDWEDSITKAANWGPVYLCDMGGKLALKCFELGIKTVRASMEGTGSGIHALKENSSQLGWPVFDWNDIPLKEGIHNRHMVGISAMHAFFNRTRLTFHGRHVLVVGFGPVGEGCVEAAQFYGGSITVVDRDPAALLRARYAGYNATNSLEEALPSADVVITATGAPNIIKLHHMDLIKDGCFLMNVGHFAFEIDTPSIYDAFSHRSVLPFIEEIIVPAQDKSTNKSIFMFADGQMANLTAGYGDSINAFDITLAMMTAGVLFMFTDEAAKFSPELHLLPSKVWKSVLPSK